MSVTNAVDRVVRNYFCKVCTTKATGYIVPLDWFIVRKTYKDDTSSNEDEGRQKTVGVYCSSSCLTVDVISNELNIPVKAAKLMLLGNSR